MTVAKPESHDVRLVEERAARIRSRINRGPSSSLDSDNPDQDLLFLLIPAMGKGLPHIIYSSLLLAIHDWTCNPSVCMAGEDKTLDGK